VRTARTDSGSERADRRVSHTPRARGEYGEGRGVDRPEQRSSLQPPPFAARSHETHRHEHGLTVEHTPRGANRWHPRTTITERVATELYRPGSEAWHDPSASTPKRCRRAGEELWQGHHVRVKERVPYIDRLHETFPQAPPVRIRAIGVRSQGPGNISLAMRITGPCTTYGPLSGDSGQGMKHGASRPCKVQAGAGGPLRGEPPRAGTRMSAKPRGA